MADSQPYPYSLDHRPAGAASTRGCPSRGVRWAERRDLRSGCSGSGGDSVAG